MAIYEVLPDGQNDWHFSEEFDTFSPERAAEMFAERTDFATTEYSYVQVGGIVQVRIKGRGDTLSRYDVTGETRPHYFASRLLSLNPTHTDRGE